MKRPKFKSYVITLNFSVVVWVHDLLAFIFGIFDLINLTFTVWCY